jgi:hypothetical protein
MTAAEPAARPDVGVFLEVLKDPEVCALGEPRPEPREAGAESAANGGGRADADAGDGGSEGRRLRAGRLRINLPAAPAPSPAPGTAAENRPAASRVRINLGGRTARPGPAAPPAHATPITGTAGPEAGSVPLEEPTPEHEEAP